MVKYKTDFLGENSRVEQIATFTIVATEANDFAVKVSSEMLEDNEYVTIGEFFPVVLNNVLHYTFTVRAGMFS